MDNQKASKILERIIEKGGLYGQCAKMYKDDDRNTGLFIKECSQQCHNQSAIDQWGKELVTDIMDFSRKNEIESIIEV